MMRADEARQSIERGAESIQQMIGRWMVLSQLLQHRTRRLVRLQFLRNLFEVLLVLVQIRPANFEQLIQRQIHHLVVFELLLKGFRTDAKVSIRLERQIRLQPLKVTVQPRNYGRIRPGKLSL